MKIKEKANLKKKKKKKVLAFTASWVTLFSSVLKLNKKLTKMKNITRKELF